MPPERTPKRKSRTTRASSSSSVELITMPPEPKARRTILDPVSTTIMMAQLNNDQDGLLSGIKIQEKKHKHEGKETALVPAADNRGVAAGSRTPVRNSGSASGRKQKAGRNGTRDEASIMHDFPNATRRLNPCSRCVKDGFTCFGSTKANAKCYTCRSGSCSHYAPDTQMDKVADLEAKLAEKNEIWKQINRFLKLSQQSRGDALDFFLKEIKRLAESIGETVDSVSGGRYGSMKNGN